MLLYYAAPENTSEESSSAVTQRIQHPERRAIIEYLDEQGGTVAVTSLASHLATETGGTLPGTISTLCNVHLPKLAAKDLVEYDLDEGTVTLDDA